MADWIRLATNLFDNKKIKQIEVAPKGKQMLLLWVRLICLAGTINDGGKVYVTDGVPYTLDGLAVELNENKSIVKNALELFERYNMIAYEEGCMYLPGWAEHQNVVGLEKIREQTRERTRLYRQRKKLSVTSNSGDASQCVTGDVTSDSGYDEVTQQNKNKNIELDIDNNNSISLSNVTQIYEQKIGLIDARVAERLADLLEQYGEERVSEGINIAHERRARTFSYVAKCVESPIPEKPKNEYIDPFKAVFGSGGNSNGND